MRFIFKIMSRGVIQVLRNTGVQVMLLKLMMTPVCPRLLNMITGFVALLSSGLRGFKLHRSYIIIISITKVSGPTSLVLRR